MMSSAGSQPTLKRMNPSLIASPPQRARRSADEFFDTFTTYYGPTFRALRALDEDGQAAFRRDLTALADEHNRSTDGTLAVPSE